MGGRALKNTPTRRYQRKEFDEISSELVEILNKDFSQVAIPLFYSKKESFGDADIIVDTTGFSKNMREYIEETFSPNEIFHNGNCWSFDYKELQVDIITTSAEHFMTNYHYLAYNDLGNFIGRIAHGLGFKYGQEGLWYEHYFKDQNIGKISISRDYRKIFEFLELSYDRWLEGFETLEDVFEYIVQSKYFDYEMFQLKSLNKINRERNLKRASYMSFLEYIEENHKDKSYQFEDKEVSMVRAIEFFPDANIELNIRKMEYEYCKKEYIKAKFNGGQVMRRFGLQGKELGDALIEFKEYMLEHFGGSETLSEYDYNEYILTHESELIYKHFGDFLASKEI